MNIDWLTKFLPKPKPPPQWWQKYDNGPLGPPPGSLPMQTPPDVETIAQSLLEHNNGLVIQPVKTIPAKGVVLHRIDIGWARIEAQGMLNATQSSGFAITLLAGLCASESAFDPWCVNGNLQGSNKQNDPWGYDMGIGQIKLRGLRDYRGISTTDEARAFAFDVNQALPYLVDIMTLHLSQADEIIKMLPAQSDAGGNSAINPKWRNRVWMAIQVYKAGYHGAQLHVQNDDFPINAAGKTRADQVADLEAKFAKQWNLKPTMADVTG